MRRGMVQRVVATLIVAVTLVLAARAGDVRGQSACSFVRGFATLRDLVGSQKVGQCLEDERFNAENGNAEQRTTGGLLVWRKADNFTAFTDGATTWVNGPEGLQSRPNNERFSWERDPVAPASPSPATPVARSAGAGGSGASAPSPAPVSTATPTPTPRPALSPTATPSPTVTRTPTPTPNPVEARFSPRPDEVDTGSVASFRVRTNVKKGTCTLTVTYDDSDPVGIGAVEIDDDRCEWRFLVPEDTDTGTAKAQVTVTGENGTVTIEDDFRVRKGKEVHGGDVRIELDIVEMPNKAKVGEEIEITIETELRNRGSCEMVVTWPKDTGATGGEKKRPNGSGRCSWRMTIPSTVTKKGDATVLAVVRRGEAVRTVTREFEVELP